MTLFQQEEVQLFTPQTAERIENKYKQLPSVVPLIVEPEQYFIMRRERDYVPIIAIVGILSFFGFLAFLAFFKPTRYEPTGIEKLEGEIREIRKELKYGR